MPEKRVTKAIELLESGKFSSVNEVVAAAGFPSRESMKNAFARAGLRSPINYLNVAPVKVEKKVVAGVTCSPKADKVDTSGLPELKQWCTPAQERAIDSLIKHGSLTGAAEALNVEPAKLRRWLSEAKRRAARAGWSPEHDMVKTVPEGFHVKGTSTFYDKDGNKKGQWVKTKADEEHRVQMLLDALEKAIEPRKGCLAPIKKPKEHPEKDILCVLPMGDPHFGMYAWAEESGDDFDLHIAEDTLKRAVDTLVSLSPRSEEALIINLGDFFHTDLVTNRTMQSGNALDVDTRWAKVLQVGIKTMQWCIDRCLERHDRVTVINVQGNHDQQTAIMLSLALSAFYSREPRVTIDCSPSPFHWYRFGKCLIGAAHGDGCKVSDLPSVMAHDRPEDWGATKHRYFYSGHVHHDSQTEHRGCIVETFRTLAAKDAWHNQQGYRSGRDMKMDILHKDYGRINRHIVGIEQLVKKK